MRSNLHDRLVSFAQTRALFFVPIQRTAQGRLLMALRADQRERVRRLPQNAGLTSCMLSAASTDSEWEMFNADARAVQAAPFANPIPSLCRCVDGWRNQPREKCPDCRGTGRA